MTDFVRVLYHTTTYGNLGVYTEDSSIPVTGTPRDAW